MRSDILPAIGSSRCIAAPFSEMQRCQSPPPPTKSLPPSSSSANRPTILADVKSTEMLIWSPSEVLIESPESTVATTQNRLQRTKKYLEYLRRKIRHVRSLEQSLSNGISLDMQQQKLLNSKSNILYLLDMLKLIYKTDREISSMNERYLCVSNGLVILCLDLNRDVKKTKINQCCYELEPLPTISTLVLPDSDFPVSMGLFKMGSNAYMIGGHKFPARFKECDLSCDLTKLFYGRNTFEGKPSLITYSLSLADGNLSLSRSDKIKPLKKSKFWPLVEKVGNKIHVIESFPPGWNYPHPPAIPSHEVLDPHNLDHGNKIHVIESFPPGWNYPRPPAIPSHEVLDPHNLDHGWTRLSSLPCEPSHSSEQFQHSTWDSLAVGDRIYSWNNFDWFDVFDTTTKKWERCAYEAYQRIPHMYSIKHVAEIMLNGYGRCVGEFRHGGSLSVGPLYVVIGVGEDDRSYCTAAAFLVTPTGQVLCYQRLPSFFGKFARVFDKSDRNGTLIPVDDKRESYCAIVLGCIESLPQQFLFVSTFTVEYSLFLHKPLPHSILSRKDDTHDLYMLPNAVEMQFVKLFVKDWHAYEFGHCEMGRRWCPHRLSACFLG